MSKSGGSKSASRAIAAATNRAIDQQIKSFDYIKDLVTPFSEGGEQAFMAQLDLLGLGGAGSQQTAIDNLTSQPYFQGLINQGEQALLANASATGQLRGGNTQAALAQFRPSMIQQLVQQQLSNLGGITATGMQGVGALAGANQNMSNTISSLTQQAGQQQAQIAASQPTLFGDLLGVAGIAGGLGWQPFASKGLTGLASFVPSDERLKSNIKRIGTHIKGFGIYSYNIFNRHEYGVLAQEVMKIVPSAVKMHPSGYLTVNYGEL